MTDRVYIQWNYVNWITVFLMAVIGYTVVSAAIDFFTSRGNADA